MQQNETIFALSSGQPPAAIAIIRISGPSAGDVLSRLTGNLPDPRVATLRTLTDPASGEILDTALVLWFPGPDTATGENLAELHLHGGRAVVRAVEACLAEQNGLRPAIAGEFTRRAFLNGRMDLAEAEGLGDLLTAETELQRQAAVSLASGQFSKQIDRWRSDVLKLSAQVEAELDFSDEDDVDDSRIAALHSGAAALHEQLTQILDQPDAEKLHEGVSVVLAGPPNSGKSTLLNTLVQREAAIVSDIAGTTRDLIDVHIAFGGVPFVFTDTAGLRREGDDVIENIGMSRAMDAITSADIILWLGPEGEGPSHGSVWEIEAQSDGDTPYPKHDPKISLSAKTGDNIPALIGMLTSHAREILPKPGSFAINARQRTHLQSAASALSHVSRHDDLLVIGEELRLVRLALDTLLGNSHTEDMLDTLFGRFCIGK